MSSHWDLARPTFLENLPEGLLKLSMPTRFVRLEMAEGEALACHIKGWWEGFGLPFAAKPVGHIAAKLGRAMSKLGGTGWFVKLGGASPRDSWLWRKARGRASSPREALGYFFDHRERVADVLHLSLANKNPPVLAVRRWREIPAWAEFRVFIEDGALRGISQYSHRTHYPGIVLHQPAIYGAIMELHMRARDHYHLERLVMDVYVEPSGEGDFEATLIEINPWCELTDACLFDWNHPFDGSFRVVGNRAVACI